jgi:CheY-like chemotaxis protein
MDRRPRKTTSGSRPRSESIDVVLVEDHDDGREMLYELLVRRRMTVRAFASVATALDAVRERVPDVVVTDLALPERGGHELAAILRSDAATAHVPLIAVTGVVDPSWNVMRWFDAYLRKPIEVEALRDLVESLYESARAARDRKAGGDDR